MLREAFLVELMLVIRMAEFGVNGKINRCPSDIHWVRGKELNRDNCQQLVNSGTKYRVNSIFYKKWCRVIILCLKLESNQWLEDCYSRKDNRTSSFNITFNGTDGHESALTKFEVDSCSGMYRFYLFSISGNLSYITTVWEKSMASYLTRLDDLKVEQKDSLQKALAAMQATLQHFENLSRHGKEMDMTEQQRMEDVFTITAVLEEFLLKFAEHHLNDTTSLINFSSEKISLQARRVFNQSEREFRLVEGTEKENDRSYIAIPSQDFGENGSLILAVLYKDLHHLLIRTQPDHHSTNDAMSLNTVIMSATVHPQNTLRKNVTMGLRSLQPGLGPRNCVFWDFAENNTGWSDRGCTVQSMSRSQTVCSCNHLTHFAVLMQFEDDTGTDKGILKVITYVGVTLSLIGIVLTIACYVIFTDVRAPLSQTRLSLVAALGAGQVIFLAGIDATENKGACVTIAALMQYFFMAAFCWMLFEGIYLYLFVVKVYNVSHKMSTCHAIAWGFPAVVVAISLSIAAGNDGIESFVSQKYCWMSSENHLIWIFITFVLVIEVLNLLILVRVIIEMTTMQQIRDNQSEQLRLGIRACVVLIPLLGITWLFGFLSSVHKVFAYIFTIFNSSQGFFVFLLHCVRNSEIKARYKRKIETSFPASDDRRTSRVPSEFDKFDRSQARQATSSVSIASRGAVI